jgi:hypothetical protein
MEVMSAVELKRHVFRSPAFKSVVDEAVRFLAGTPVHPLPPTKTFAGAGVYAIYYCGGYGPYRPLANLNKKQLCVPIYVGKAVPPGWRTARTQFGATSDLSNRLRQHAASIKFDADLDIKDFACRFLILTEVEGDLVVPVEAELIRRFKPLWNTVVDGFGNHDPGKGRYEQALSEWDALHPGRLWAKRLRGKSPSATKVLERIKAYMAGLGR